MSSGVRAPEYGWYRVRGHRGGSRCIPSTCHKRASRTRRRNAKNPSWIGDPLVSSNPVNADITVKANDISRFYRYPGASPLTFPINIALRVPNFVNSWSHIMCTPAAAPTTRLPGFQNIELYGVWYLSAVHCIDFAQ